MAVTVDVAGAGGSVAFGSSLTISHTIGASATAIVVSVMNNETSSITATSVKIGATSFTQLAIATPTGGLGTGNIQLFGLLNPPTGTQSIVITMSTSTYLDAGSVSYNGVTALGTGVSNKANSPASTSMSLSVTNASGGMVVCAFGDNDSSGSVSAYSGTSRYTIAGAGFQHYPQVLGDSSTVGTVNFTATAPGTSGWGAVGVPLSGVASISSLKDTFNNGIGAAWSTTGSSDTTEVVGQGNAVYISHTAATQYNFLFSASTYSWTGDSAYVQILDFGNQTIATHEVTLMALLDTNNKVFIRAMNNTIQAWKVVAGTSTQIGSNVTLDYSNHKWFRIRESGGTTFFDTAPNGVNWTNQWSVANPFAMTSLSAYLQSGSGTETFPSGGIFDNFNCLDPSPYNYVPVKIANKYVGPMALRHLRRQPIQVAPRRRTDDFFK